MRSIIAGILTGIIIGNFFFMVMAYGIAEVATPGYEISQTARQVLFTDMIFWAMIPGAIIGTLWGIGLPALMPAGQFTVIIGGLTWIVVTITAIISQWGYILQYPGKCIGIILMMIVAGIIAVPGLCEKTIAPFTEKIRYGGE